MNTTERYTYDAVGNRLSSFGLSSWTYDSSNQLLSTPATSFAYDNNGNLTSKTEAIAITQYSWDAENRLTRVTKADGTVVTFKYDPFGRRIQKASGGAVINYVYDGANIVAEYSSTGTLLARYTQGAGIDEPLALQRGAATAYYHADGLGSITSLTSSDGSMLNTYSYDSFGNTTANETIANSFRYTGREWDRETGLYYYRARYYDPQIGRFISEDPIDFEGGMNFYEYVGNDPNDWIDPLGLRLIPKPGSGQQGRSDLADYNAALAYLRQNPAMAAVIKTLENSPQNFYVRFINDGNDRYCPSGHYGGCGAHDFHTVFWDPRSALKCTNGTKQSPALGLGHELAHASGDGKRTRHLLLVSDSQFGNKEERRVITTYEIPAAIQFHEGIRWDHYGTTFVVQSPTSH